MYSLQNVEQLNQLCGYRELYGHIWLVYQCVELEMFVIDLFTPRVNNRDMHVVLTFNLWCGYFNETFSTVLCVITFVFQYFTQLNLAFFLNFALED